MGAGISAAILIEVEQDGFKGKKYFSNTFLDNYEKVEDNEIYTIKKDLLLKNYSNFLDEFYGLIGEPDEFKDRGIPAVSTFEEFEEAFSRDARGGWSPYIYETRGMFSFLGGKSSRYWHFYSGSYKAYLETYCSLLHFERVLQKTMKNPLADVIKFGIFG